MKKLLVLLMVCSTVAFADMTPMNDSELSSVSAKSNIALLLNEHLADFTSLALDEQVDPELLFNRLNDISREFGIEFGKITIDGVSYGDFSLVINGRSLELPSHFDRISIGEISIGGAGNSAGSIVINNLDIDGSIRITTRP